MDTQLTTASERAVELRKQLAALEKRRQETDSALAREHETQLKATAERATLVEELAGADDATAGWAHREIDRLDSKLRVSSRVSESLSNSLSRIGNEIAAVEPELRNAQVQVEQEQRAKGCEELRGQLERASRQLAHALDDARLNFGFLHLVASEGIDKYGVDALRICEAVFGEFNSAQVGASLTARGLYREMKGYGNTIQTSVSVQPMKRG